MKWLKRENIVVTVLIALLCLALYDRWETSSLHRSIQTVIELNEDIMSKLSETFTTASGKIQTYTLTRDAEETIEDFRDRFKADVEALKEDTVPEP